MPPADKENGFDPADTPPGIPRFAARAAGALRRPLIGVGLVVIFALAAAGRFGLPPEPMLDPDSRGYLNPALIWLSGDGFQQVDGRGHLYPLFLWAVLVASRSFSAITTVQHAAGLLSGVAWCWAWWLWMSFLPAGFVRRWLAPVAGLGALAVYLWGSRTILFEHMIRPEAVFSGVGLLQIAFGLAFVRACRGGGHRIAIASYAAAGLITAAVAVNLKPSWGFAVLVPILLVLVALWRGGRLVRISAAFGVCIGLLGASVPAVVLPALAGWKKDNRSRTFLAETLASVHGVMISQSLSARAQAGLLDPGEARFAEDYAATVRSAIDGNFSYPVLGVDCDEILYRSGLFGRLPHGANRSPELLRRYLLALYFQALRDQPLAFAQKWGRQFLLAYRPSPKDIFRPKLRLRLNYERTLEAGCPDFRGHLPAGWQDRLDAFWARCIQLAAAAPEEVTPAVKIPPGLIGWMASILLFSVTVLPAMSAVIFSSRGRLRVLRPAAAASLVILAVSFASTASVAIVHSFDLDRYLNLLVPADVMLVACALILVAAAVAATLPGRGKES